jgi:hypothetical protein
MALADFCSLPEARAYISPNRTDPGAGADDVHLGLAITAASDAIRQTSNRSFELQTVAGNRNFTATYPYSANLGALAYWYPWPGVFPFTALTSTLPAPILKVDGFFLTNQTIGNITVTDRTTLTTYTPLYGYPYNVDAEGSPFEGLVFAPGTSMSTIEGQMIVNAKWGWITIPSTIKQACLLQTSRYLKRRDFPFGMAGLDPDIDMMLSSYRRIWAAV